MGCFDHLRERGGRILRENSGENWAQRFVPLSKPSDQELRTAAMMALGKELRLATQQCCGGKGNGILEGDWVILIYIYMYTYDIYFRDTQPGKMVVNKGPFQKTRSSSQLRYDSFAFQADAEQQLELHGPRLLAAALVPLADKNLWSK